MLAQLTISNFAIVRELEIDFQNGMTVITGETGAGKSIAIDALGLCLGGRADADMVRAGATRADLCARFALKDTPAALRWLEENQLEEGRECLLRRVISSDGRSRGFINGTAVPLSQLRELGQLLIQIHGQHAHQLLTKSEHQKSLLDGYANEASLTQEMAARYQLWHQSCRDLAHHQQQSQERAARAELLQYQLKELNEFNRSRVNLSKLMKSTSVWLTAGNCSPPANRRWLSWRMAKTSTCKANCTLQSSWSLNWQAWTADFPVSWICWKRPRSNSAKPATSCATIAIVWIWTLTVCLNLNSVFPNKSHWPASIMLPLKRCHSSISHCWMNNSS